MQPRLGPVVVVLTLVAVVALGVWQWEWDVSGLEAWMHEHVLLGALAYVGALAASIVLLPLSSLPLLPLAAHVYGVVGTAALSTAGWWLGSLVAFRIARWGRRHLERFTSLEAVDRLERTIPEDIGFAGVVVLRMIFPVDIVSFALGLLKHLRFRVYAIASLIGIIPFAFVWSFAGGELRRGALLSFAVVVIGMIAGVILVQRVWKTRRR